MGQHREEAQKRSVSENDYTGGTDDKHLWRQRQSSNAGLWKAEKGGEATSTKLSAAREGGRVKNEKVQ